MEPDQNEKNKNLHVSPIANSTEEILAHSPQPLTDRRRSFPLIRIVIVLIVMLLSVVGVGVAIIFSALDKEAIQDAEWAAKNPYKSCERFEGKTYTLPVEKTITSPDNYYDQFEVTVHNVTYNIPGDEEIGYDCVKGTGVEVTIKAIEDEEGYSYGVTTSNLKLVQNGTEVDSFSASYKFDDYINEKGLRQIGYRVGAGITTRGWLFYTSKDTEPNTNMVFKFSPYSTRYTFEDIVLPVKD